MNEEINEYYKNRLETSLICLKRIVSEAKFQNYDGDSEIKKEWKDLYDESQMLLEEYNKRDTLEKVFVEHFCHMALGVNYQELELNINSECSNAGWYGCY